MPTENMAPQQIIDEIKKKITIMVEQGKDLSSFEDLLQFDEEELINPDPQYEKTLEVFALFKAINDDKVDVANLLLEVDSNSKIILLHAAASLGSIEIVKMLIERFGKNLVTLHENESRDKYKYLSLVHEALSDAIYSNNTDILEILLQQGAKIDAENGFGLTELMSTLITFEETNTNKVLEILLKYGANTEAKDRKARTALLLLAKDNYADGCQILLKYGANTEAKDRKGRTEKEGHL